LVDWTVVPGSTKVLIQEHALGEIPFTTIAQRWC